MNKPTIACVDGDFTAITNARVSVLDRGLLFADAVYEVFAVIQGRCIDRAAHLARLRRSLGELQLTPPIPVAEIPELMRELIQRERLSEGMIYLQITRGADVQRQFSFPDSGAVPGTFVMFCQEKSLVRDPLAETGGKAITIPDIRWRRRDIKSTSLLPQVLGKQLATEAGAVEAIMVENGFVTEGTSSAVGILVNGSTLVTRPLSNDILDSVTRRAIFSLARRTDLRLEARKFTIEEAYAADEVFVTSATALVMPIVEIDGRSIGRGVPGPWVPRLRREYLDVARGDGSTDMAKLP